MKLADRIRGYVIDELITPARQAGQGQITVRAGDVHQNLGLDNRMPAVCGALDAAKFYDQARVTLIQRNGPHQGSTAEWVLGL
jgi:5-methylcytosine-specific restriction protein B